MHNLLADKERREVTIDYFLRLAAACFFGFGFVAVAGMLLLLPSYGYLSARGDAANATPSSALADKIRFEEASLELAKEMLALVPTQGNVAGSVVIGRVRAAAISAKGVDLLFVGYQTSGAVSVRGVARTRDALIAFGKALRADPMLTSITVPVELLAKSRDISFELSGKLPK